MSSQSLTLYRPSTITPTKPRSINLYRAFSAETGTFIATELLYRILMAICQRFFNAFEEFASRRLEQFSTYLETSATEKKTLGIVEELAAKENEGFHPICPITGKHLDPPVWARKRMEQGGGPRRPPGPPEWAKRLVLNWREGAKSKDAREDNIAGYGHNWSFE